VCRVARADGFYVSWQGDPTVEPSFANVSPQQRGWAGGGRIVITEVEEGAGGGETPDVVEFVLPQPDTRWFRAGLEAPIVVAGSVLPVWAEAGGEVIDLYVRSAWGYQGPLQPVSAQWWEGGLPVPAGVAPGVYWVEIGAMLGQQYYQPRRFLAPWTLIVLSRATGEGGQGAELGADSTGHDDWWTLPGYSAGW